ncbi:FtsL-like putative cell division protein [Rhodocytophaga aerolata]|uniref:FtsL-like putative cell division protein n=1 Tax=Rhodocytophaga aerolata TaxID=455078 RepID=A0ABT8R139_9BACT|nr:FtsL-like putative cell division protein [Rhodocytophaga aerolata]MDO1445807.1 FtsL-like putative cell division protein [Rhodocytophaga aerolata]
MAVNTFKQEKKPVAPPKKTKKGGSFFKFIESYVKLGIIFENGLPVKYIPYILFTAAMGIFYIGNIHYADKTVRALDKLKLEVDDLRAEFITLRASFEYEGKQSEVARKVAPMGLSESSEPPYKIIVRKKEEEENE